MRFEIFVTLTLTLVLLVTHQARAAEGILIETPYVRAMPTLIKNTAAYLKLYNPDDQPRTLVGAQSAVARLTELHTHVHENGMMKMRRVDKINIAPNDSIEMKPGGKHIMLIGLQQDLNKVESIEITLLFDNGEQLAIEFPVTGKPDK
jgi:copper(I)-binding protein